MISKKINSIFLIDDDHITNFINARLVSRLRLTESLLISQNGKEAIGLLEECLAQGKQSPSLIFLDINMPVMDGFEFVEKFGLLPFINKEEVLIYMLTTSENSKDIEKVTSNERITGFINKPLTEDKILKIVQKHFN